MAHDKHIIDNINKEINFQYPNLDSYLNLTSGFESRFDPVSIRIHDGVYVAREDKIPVGGSKARAGEYYFSMIEEDTVVYCMPRVGHAASAVISLCEMYNKNVVLFAPSCKEMSDHQAYACDLIDKMPSHLSGKVIWRRIPAMPNLNRMAKNYADKYNYNFIPFGLNHPLVIAGYVRICQGILSRKSMPYPDEIWSVVSTGVLTRGLQIGFEDAHMRGVAVARNMKAGELGRTKIQSEDLAFTTEEKLKNLPPFDSVRTYDAKAWKYIPKDNKKVRLFWNVASEIYLPEGFDKSKHDSFREWGDDRE